MWSKKEIFIFLAGASAFHALSHILIHILIPLPIQFGPITLTQSLNTFATIFNIVLTVFLLWFAQRQNENNKDSKKSKLFFSAPELIVLITLLLMYYLIYTFSSCPLVS